jgi:hypothetical protein
VDPGGSVAGPILVVVAIASYTLDSAALKKLIPAI